MKQPMTVAEVLSRLDQVRDQMPTVASGAARRPNAPGDQRDGSVYLLDDDTLLAVKVAVATNRPLLLTGDPGTGKSSLAAYLAARLSWRYYEQVVTSRTEANDLLWTFDTVRKLGDATGATTLADTDYVEPGVLWWAFDRADAASRGVSRAGSQATGSQATEPFRTTNAARSPDHAVVLIDEIDKADPDVPNALLVPLGSNQFIVRETQVPVAAPAPPRSDGPPASAVEPLASAVLVVITSNGERDLPPAFLRRCVSHQLQAPDSARLVKVARAHAAIEGRTLDGAELSQVEKLATKAVEIRDDLARAGRKGAGTAEFLDAVRASRELAISDTDADTWNKLLTLTLRKSAARS